MIDETSPKWLIWYKRLIIVTFLFGIVGQVIWITQSKFDILWLFIDPSPLNYDNYETTNKVLLILLFAISDTFYLFTNMVLINFLRNVQIIKDMLTEKHGILDTEAEELPDL